MNLQYFKHHIESCECEVTYYGSYDAETDIQEQGDIQAEVYAIAVNRDEGKYSYDCHTEFFETDEITPITHEEYHGVMKALTEVDHQQAKLNDLLEALI